MRHHSQHLSAEHRPLEPLGLEPELVLRSTLDTTSVQLLVLLENH